VRFLLLLLLFSAPSERTGVFHLDAVPKDQIGLRTLLKRIKGVTGVGIDPDKGELVLRLVGVKDEAVSRVLAKQGLSARPLPDRANAGGPDTLVLTPVGAAVGPLQELRVPGKYTVFDAFADWCAPCEIVDDALRKILDERTDVAVRRLNVVSFDSPLGVELDLDALPHVVVFSPLGERTEIDGADIAAIRECLKAP
jgi:hypothetical protein